MKNLIKILSIAGLFLFHGNVFSSDEQFQSRLAVLMQAEAVARAETEKSILDHLNKLLPSLEGEMKVGHIIRTVTLHGIPFALANISRTLDGYNGLPNRSQLVLEVEQNLDEYFAVLGRCVAEYSVARAALTQYLNSPSSTAV